MCDRIRVKKKCIGYFNVVSDGSIKIDGYRLFWKR